MQLGRPKKQNDIMKDLTKEQLFNKPVAEELKAEEPAANFNPLSENVMLEIEEKVSASVTKDGDIEKFEIKGIIYMTISDPKKNNPMVEMDFQ
jgi:hypothetical protein